MTGLRAFAYRVIVTCMLCVGVSSLLPTAEARPGGGHSSSSHSSSSSRSSSSSSGRSSSSWHSSSGSSSWSGSSSSYNHSSSSGSSDAELEDLVTFLVIVIILIVVLLIIGRFTKDQPQTLSSKPTRAIKNQRSEQLSRELTVLKKRDPNFSQILLIDFVHLLFTKLYRYAGTQEFSYLTPFISTALQQQYQFLAPQPAQEVVINGMQWESINQQDQEDNINLLIDANYTLNLHGQKTRYVVTERWQLARRSGLLSAEPQNMQALTCPNCAAPAHFNDAGVCPYCKNELQQGEAQWYLKQRVITQTTQLDSTSLVSYAEETGTQLPTLKQAGLSHKISAFVDQHRLEQWDSFFEAFKEQTVRSYFLAIYQHWSERNWDGVRHLISDRLFAANQFWTDNYKQQHWINRLEQLQIERIELAKIDMDKFYEAITVRIFAACFDYTETEQGKLIGGSKKTLRHYSEYWTFVRRSGQEAKPSPFSIQQCPQCGAPADQMGQAAECGFCGSKISTGEFSWVLFLITQDEAYTD